MGTRPARADSRSDSGGGRTDPGSPREQRGESSQPAPGIAPCRKPPLAPSSSGSAPFSPRPLPPRRRARLRARGRAPSVAQRCPAGPDPRQLPAAARAALPGRGFARASILPGGDKRAAPPLPGTPPTRRRVAARAAGATRPAGGAAPLPPRAPPPSAPGRAAQRDAAAAGSDVVPSWRRCRAPAARPPPALSVAAAAPAPGPAPATVRGAVATGGAAAGPAPGSAAPAGLVPPRTTGTTTARPGPSTTRRRRRRSCGRGEYGPRSRGPGGAAVSPCPRAQAPNGTHCCRPEAAVSARAPVCRGGLCLLGLRAWVGLGLVFNSRSHAAIEGQTCPQV